MTWTLVVVTAFACGNANGGGGSGASRGAAGARAIPVEIGPVVAGEVAVSSEYLATVRSRDSAVIAAQVAGYVSDIYVSSGDRVRRGTPLLQLDPRRQRATFLSSAAAAQGARAELERARSIQQQLEASRSSRVANLRLAEVEHQRSVRLNASGAISRAELDKAQTALLAARADVDAADAQLAAQEAATSGAADAVGQASAAAQSERVELDYYRVTAPVDGVVGDIPIRVGDYVHAASPVTTVEANDILEAYVSVPGERAAELHPGQIIELYGPGDTRVATTRTFFISPAVNEATQTVLVKARLEGEVRDVKPSQFFRARVIWAMKEGLRIPVTAVTRINGQPFVFVVADGTPPTAHQRAVVLGSIEDNLVVVEKGVSGGERVVTLGAQKLRDGAPVQP